ncbi:hypothetical protein Q5530_31795 [Saccharothrix sp. BKS2]
METTRDREAPVAAHGDAFPALPGGTGTGAGPSRGSRRTRRWSPTT